MKNFIFFGFFAIYSLCLTACATLEKQIQAEYDSDQYIRTYESIHKAMNTTTNNILLWKMQAGFLTFSYFGPVFSLIELDNAETIYKKYEQEGILSSAFNSVAATFSNDMSMSYKGNIYEGSLLNFYKALAYSSLEDSINARIEFNRANDRQRRAKEYYQKEIAKAHDKAIQNANKKQQSPDYATNTSDSKINAILTQRYSNLNNFAVYKDLLNPMIPYISGIFFMLEKDYTKAIDLLKESYGITHSNIIANDMMLLESRQLQEDSNNYTWFIIEDGNISRKQDNSFSTSLLLGGNVASINLALPSLSEGKSRFKTYKVNTYRADSIAKISALFGSEFEKQLPIILTRAIISAIVKLVTVEIANHIGGDYGALTGLLTSVIFNAATSADTRGSFILPDSVWVARIPNDNNKIAIYGDDTLIINLNFTPNCNSLAKRIESHQAFLNLIKQKPKDFHAKINLFKKYKPQMNICAKTDNIIYIRVHNNVATYFTIKGN
ncbi:hypothetical protein CQA66_06735 [Helicobacter aurati]|uniref:Lipoprotein n=1 Tax=Helicobacter aurati TaxID=137778 RepID=A0A3D8J205_9HELI|nr:hypothetical protein [Helicobacter aurati]RDU71236.1 hypothetical protein CQA66_06735 [Helicobacter aurati]